MNCRIALRGAMSERISAKTEKGSKLSGLFDHSNRRYSVCATGSFVRHACQHIDLLKPTSSIFQIA